jgi:hypothetical protein
MSGQELVDGCHARVQVQGMHAQPALAPTIRGMQLKYLCNCNQHALEGQQLMMVPHTCRTLT